MQQKIGTLRLALTFAGCFLGAGYVSGQELWQYFGAFGARGLLGLALAVVLLGGTGVLLLRLSARTGIETMDALIVRADIPWLRTAVGVLTAALLFGVVCIMAAGIGALGNQMLGLPVWLGAAGIVYAVLLFLGMFGTSVSSLVAVLTYAGQKSAWLAGHRTALLLVLTAAAFAGSLFGFGDLIGTVYPVYGYLGMAAMLLVAEHAVHARRAGNNRAATGD